ncbi:putative holin-like toxin [Virgibacillus halophilus]
MDVEEALTLMISFGTLVAIIITANNDKK